MKTLRTWFRALVHDRDLRESIHDALDDDPDLGRYGSVDVSVHHGVVSVSGTMYSIAQTWAVARAIRRAAGDVDVRDLLVVLPPKALSHPDEEIAQVASTVLAWIKGVPDGIAVSVLDGCVVLHGTVASMAEKLAADNAVRALVGVKEILNQLAIAPPHVTADVTERMKAAIDRRVGARDVSVACHDGSATLEGTVASLEERTLAEDAARHTAGVTSVVDRLDVGGW